MSNFLITAIDILYWALFALILARIILSWVQFGSYEIRAFIFRITDPILAPIQKILPRTGGVEFIPLIVNIQAQFVRVGLQRLVASIL
jgi:YggT family protein